MALLGSIHVREPTLGARRLNAVLRRDHGYSLGRRRLRRLMRAARIRVSYRRPRTSIPAVGHKIYPYLLCGLDITYIPMARGFCYLACVMDWHTREALGWTDTLTMALATGKTRAFLSAWLGTVRWIDNFRIERLWRTAKYEDVYLKAYATPRELGIGLADW